MPCQTSVRPVVKAFDMDKKKLYLYQVKCKSWYCPHCGHVNKLQWIAKISQGIDIYQEQGVGEWMFCTLTASSKLTNHGARLWVEPRAWKKLWSRIHYHHGAVRYVYIPEIGEKGKVHWHFLMSGGIPVSWWKRHAPKTGFGYIVDSQVCRDGHHSVLYVSKELSKSLAKSKWPRNLRRIRTNQKWPQIAPDDDFNELELPWVYYCQEEQENMETLRYDTELATGIETIVLSPEK